MSKGKTGLGEIWSLARSRTRGENGAHAKGALRQMIEMAGLLALRGIGPGFYQLAGFWRRDVPWRHMLRYMNPKEYAAAVDRLNKPAYHKLSQNKVVEKAIMRLYGIATTELLGILNPVTGQTLDGAPLRDAVELEGFLASLAPRRVCFKANEGWGGSAFRALELTLDNGRLDARDLRDGAPVEIPALFESFRLNRDRIMVIETMMEQHPALAAFNPTSVNTLRLWVIDHGQGLRTRLAYLRMGRAGAVVDNFTSGGIVAPIDMATGALGKATDGTAAHLTFSHHPDNGAPIEGVALPFFAEAQRLAERCLAVFPRINFAGIDVAIAPEGPVIIEMNVVPDMVGAARVGIPTKDALAPF